MRCCLFGWLSSVLLCFWRWSPSPLARGHSCPSGWPVVSVPWQPRPGWPPCPWLSSAGITARTVTSGQDPLQLHQAHETGYGPPWAVSSTLTIPTSYRLRLSTRVWPSWVLKFSFGPHDLLSSAQRIWAEPACPGTCSPHHHSCLWISAPRVLLTPLPRGSQTLLYRPTRQCGKGSTFQGLGFWSGCWV